MTPLRDHRWTDREKKIARRAFELALQTELKNFIAEFKAKANSVTEVGEVWEVRDWLNSRGQEIDGDFDYRYSVLISVFARLVRSGKIDLNTLAGLDEQKLQEIMYIAQL